MSDNPYKFYDVSSPEALRRAARFGSYWFYWIGGLSLINTLLFYAGAPIQLAIGLGFTQLVDGLVAAIFPQLYYLSLVINVVIAAAFVGFGYLSGRADITAFIIGLVVYIADGLLYVLLMFFGQELFTIIPIIWHGIAGYGLWKGLRAARELKTLAPANG